ncbi:MAG TPA: histidine--tRNA ligase [Candidatus Faecivivens stercoravium]|uniref:Histidine--tRNA ligase n=1 Tax=Candidatus Faecivivens stercoravium TaxID=2840803 RepID=A0A9D1DZJ5_9FIRM|nr:histidine--tRNA ligase [Candidatus Faecivivens stercoravium]
MALEIKSIKGTADVLPSDSYKWQFVERKFLDTAQKYGFGEIRVPTFEDKRLFIRSVGDTTDVVQKEMYTFTDQGGRELALRPEGTAGVNRAVIENGLINGALPVKLSYAISCFRAEKPQAGRMREFHQLGMELFGASSPSADAEVIAFVDEFFRLLGIRNISLEINSIGCKECRKNYHAALKSYFEARKDRLCDTCLERLDKNPLRILDCKNPDCKEVAKDAPVVLDYLCDDCRAHFEGLKKRLDALGVPYTVNPRIVRGLDYYVRTVFEFVSSDLGAQSTVCGGGRYDGLIKSLGGPDQPGIGYAMGVERLLMVMKAQGIEIPAPAPCDLYIGSIGEEASVEALRLCGILRGEGFSAECDIVGRSVKAQMKYADKIGARFSMVLGDNELAEKKATVKNMATGENAEVMLDGEPLKQFLYNAGLDGLSDSLKGTLGGILENMGTNPAPEGKE